MYNRHRIVRLTKIKSFYLIRFMFYRLKFKYCKIFLFIEHYGGIKLNIFKYYLVLLLNLIIMYNISKYIGHIYEENTNNSLNESFIFQQ